MIENLSEMDAVRETISSRLDFHHLILFQQELFMTISPGMMALAEPDIRGSISWICIGQRMSVFRCWGILESNAANIMLMLVARPEYTPEF